MNKRVITPKRTLLTEKFLLVPFGTFFVSEQKRHFQDRALAIIPLTKQDMADASSSVSIESCESLHELICRCRCGKTFLIELYEEVAALQCFLEHHLAEAPQDLKETCCFSPFCVLCGGRLGAKEGTCEKRVLGTGIGQSRTRQKHPRVYILN